MAPNQPDTSQFNARADSAAQRLRQQLRADGAQIAESRTVEVGPDGKPPAPLPPPGSYARQALENQRAQAVAQRAGSPSAEQVLGDQPVAGTMDQAIDGSQAPPLSNGQTPRGAPEDQLSANAQRRIAELVAELRAKDQSLQQLQAETENRTKGMQELEAKLMALATEHQRMIQANLDNLDPETRMQVMQDARIQEALAGFEARIMARLQPQIQGLEQRNQQAEMMKLAEKYPRFDIQIHGPLIGIFRGKNPHCSIEQAFRAIAEADELVTRDMARVTAVPPVVPPGNGAPLPRYAPKPEPDQDAQLVEESRRIRELRSSADPNDQRAGLRMVEEHLKKRVNMLRR